MDTWNVDLILKRNGKEDLKNTKYIRMDGLTPQMQNIKLRNLTAKMTEDFISFLNNENDYTQRCGNCGGEYLRRLMGNEYFLYCPDCGMGENE